MKRIAKSLAVVAVSAGLLAGCGGNSQSAAVEQVCSDRTNLHNSIDSVKTDVSNLNFGKAKDGLADVKKSFNNLVQSAKQLKGEEAKTLQPQIDALKTNIENLTERQLSHPIDIEPGHDLVPDPIPLHPNN